MCSVPACCLLCAGQAAAAATAFQGSEPICLSSFFFLARHGCGQSHTPGGGASGQCSHSFLLSITLEGRPPLRSFLLPIPSLLPLVPPQPAQALPTCDNLSARSRQHTAPSRTDSDQNRSDLLEADFTIQLSLFIPLPVYTSPAILAAKPASSRLTTSLETST